jgi:3alpha(or 20beta)-hydroxysteroid dehydrogenase
VSRLDGYVALVTGAARGQGAAHVRELAARGAAVVASDILDDSGILLAEELRNKGHDVAYVRHDVTSERGWQDVADRAMSRFGRIDGLVNNAGIIHVTRIEEETLDAFNRLLSVNLTGTMLGMKHVLPHMRRAGSGSIVNVSSTAAHSGAPGYAAYAASKAAVSAMTRVAALEYATAGIRVNAIVPGGVTTPMNDDEPATGMGPGTPMGRRARPEEISPLVAYLLSADAGFVTGAEFAIDGGYLAQ